MTDEPHRAKPLAGGFVHSARAIAARTTRLDTLLLTSTGCEELAITEMGLGVILILRDELPPGEEHGRPLIRAETGLWEIYDGYPFAGPHVEPGAP